MKTKYTIIEPDQKDLESLTWAEHEFRSVRPSYTEMACVIGPLFPDSQWERVAVNWVSGAADMFVDATGSPMLMSGRPGQNLPENREATRVYWTANRMHQVASRDRAGVLGYKEIRDVALLETSDLLQLGSPMPRIYGRAVLFHNRIWF